MVDNLHSDLAGLRLVEQAASGRIQFRPSRFIHIDTERLLQHTIRYTAVNPTRFEKLWR
jgi:hypothetical protein